MLGNSNNKMKNLNLEEMFTLIQAQNYSFQ